MADEVLQSPTNPHFFQPLLPNFNSHLTIPLAFLKHLQGRNKPKTVKLRSNASDTTWEVSIDDGWRLTRGWKEFVTAHDLRIGDIIVFRHDGDLLFHVTPLGPSCCEIDYTTSSHNIGLRKYLKTKNLKHCSRPIASSSFSQYRFVILNVTPYSFRSNKMGLPAWFTSANGISKPGKITLMGQDGVKRIVSLLKDKTRGTMRLGRGWKRFCEVHGVKIGESFRLELIWEKDASPMLKFCTKVNSV